MFYVIALSDTFEFRKFSKNNDQLIASLNRKGSNVLIFRSKKAKNAKPGDMQKMKEDVEKLKETQPADGDWSSDEEVKKKAGGISNCAFMSLVCSRDEVGVASTKTDVDEWGPGWWVWETYARRPGPQVHAQTYLLLSGFE